jgi:cell fate regulator YaaT (PSP1 superfamily)
MEEKQVEQKVDETVEADVARASEGSEDIEKTEPVDEAKSSNGLGVGIQYKTAGKIYTFVTTDDTLSKHDAVMVESDSGEVMGVVIRPPDEKLGVKVPKNAKRVIRRASEEDKETWRRNGERAIECFRICKEKVAERDLQMKLVDAEISTSGNKVTFSFFAEQRIDFRGLVKELAHALRMRIEMCQIGARDEAKNIPCMGSCGRPTCCSLHLRQFQSISISMAKHQGLAPNPSKLTGMCGKLKCCLSYEHAAYAEKRKGLPKLGSAVECPKGIGKVVGHNVLKRECIIRLYGGAGEARCDCEECRKLSPTERDAAIEAMRKKREEDEEARAARRRPRRGSDKKDNKNSRSDNKRPDKRKSSK